MCNPSWFRQVTLKLSNSQPAPPADLAQTQHWSSSLSFTSSEPFVIGSRLGFPLSNALHTLSCLYLVVYIWTFLDIQEPIDQSPFRSSRPLIFPLYLCHLWTSVSQGPCRASFRSNLFQGRYDPTSSGKLYWKHSLPTQVQATLAQVSREKFFWKVSAYVQVFLKMKKWKDFPSESLVCLISLRYYVPPAVMPNRS